MTNLQELRERVLELPSAERAVWRGTWMQGEFTSHLSPVRATPAAFILVDDKGHDFFADVGGGCGY